MTEQEEKRGGITTHAVGTGVACIKGLTELKARHDAAEARESETGDCNERSAILDELHDYHYGILFRGGWHELDSNWKKQEAEEFQILLAGGGPAARIYGEIDQHNSCEYPRLEVQDWLTPWVDILSNEQITPADREALQWFTEYILGSYL